MSSSNDFRRVRGLHLTHLNIRSLWANYDLFKQYLMDSNVTCASLSETWLNLKIPDELITIPNYCLIRLDRQTCRHNTEQVKSGGGLAFYVKNDINFSKMELLKHNVRTSDIEIQWLTLTPPKSKKIIIGNLYRPPNGRVGIFLETLSKAVEEISGLTYHETYIMGDANIDFSKTNDKSRNSLNALMNYVGLKQIINETTRFSRQSNSVIDLIFTNSNKISDSGTKHLNISDHELIFVTRKMLPKVKQRTGLSYRNYSKETIQGDLQNMDWTNLYASNNPDEAWNTMIKNITQTLDRY